MYYFGYTSIQAKQLALADNAFASKYAISVLDHTVSETILVPDGGDFGAVRNVVVAIATNVFDGYTSIEAGHGIIWKINGLYGETIIDMDYVNLGFVSGGSQEGYTVWNNTGHDLVVESITHSNGDAVITGLGDEEVFRNGAEVPLVFTWNTDNVQFDTSVIWTFYTGETLELRILGRISALIPDMPQMPTIEFLSFMTDVQVSEDGTEQRIANRTRPRLKYSATYLHHGGNEAEKLFHLLLASTTRPLQVPAISDMTPCTVKPQIGDTRVLMSTAYSSFVVNDYALFVDQRGNNESVAILADNGDSLDLHEELTVQFYGQVHCYPIRFVFMEQRGKVKSFPSGAKQLDCDFLVTENPSVEDPILPLYEGHPVFETARLMQSDSFDLEGLDNSEFVDSGTGVFSKRAGMLGAKPVFQVGVHRETAEESWEFRQLLHYMRGRQRPVWVSTHSIDFIQSRTLNGSGTTLYVENNGYFDTFTAGYSTHIEVVAGGVTYRRSITDAVVVANEIRLDLDTPLGITYEIGEMRLSHLYLCRGKRDTAEIEWAAAGELYCALELVGVKA